MVVHEVPLNDVPPELEVPAALKDRFWYDEDRKRLCFDGFMSKADFDRLEGLCRDWQYQHALDELFRICVPEYGKARRISAKIVIVLATVIGLAVLCGLVVWLLRT